MQVGRELRTGVHPRRAVVVGSPDLRPHDVSEALVDHDVQVDRVPDRDDVRREDGREDGVVVLVRPQLLRRVAADRAGPRDAGVEVGGVRPERDRRTPPAATYLRVLERVAEHEQQPAVGRTCGYAEVGRLHAVLRGEAGPGEVLDLGDADRPGVDAALPRGRRLRRAGGCGRPRIECEARAEQGPSGCLQERRAAHVGSRLPRWKRSDSHHKPCRSSREHYDSLLPVFLGVSGSSASAPQLSVRDAGETAAGTRRRPPARSCSPLPTAPLVTTPP